MHRVAVALLFTLFTATASADSKSDALSAYDQFFKTFTTDNHDAVTSLFAPDALFYGTNSTEAVTTTTGIREYFIAALSGKRGSVKAVQFEKTAVALSDDVVLTAGKWQSERTLAGKTTTAGPSRNTVVMQKRGGSWIIAQFHNSPTPKPPAAVSAPTKA
jgi:uncharacterized protein (TIGR02246 family)